MDSGYKVISHGQPQLVLYSDSSKKGWGAYNETENIRTGGKWSATEQESHINILKLANLHYTLSAKMSKTCMSEYIWTIQQVVLISTNWVGRPQS